MSSQVDIVAAEERWLDEAEKVRRKHSKQLIRMQVVLFVSFAVLFGTLIAASSALITTTVSIILAIGALTTAFGTGLIYYYEQRDVQAAVKHQLIAPLLQRFDQQLEYFPKKGIRQADLKGSTLFPHTNSIHSNDLIRGRYGKTAFTCAYLEVHQTGKGSRRKYWRGNRLGSENINASFTGLLLIADGNKHFKGRTLVVPDDLEQYLGRWFSKIVSRLNHRGLENTVLEHPEFERAFEVYTTDQVEARYLLTPDVMERILQLKQELGKDIRIAYAKGKVFIAVDDVENLNINLYQSLQASQASERVQAQWMLIQQLIDGLGLNERIWTKE